MLNIPEHFKCYRKLIEAVFGEVYYPSQFLNKQLQIDLIKTVQEVLKTLTDKERLVLYHRYGLKNGKPMTLQKARTLILNKKTGKYVNGERIRQIQGKALRKLRHPTRSNRLKFYLDDLPQLL